MAVSVITLIGAPSLPLAAAVDPAALDAVDSPLLAVAALLAVELPAAEVSLDPDPELLPHAAPINAMAVIATAANRARRRGPSLLVTVDIRLPHRQVVWWW